MNLRTALLSLLLTAIALACATPAHAAGWCLGKLNQQRYVAHFGGNAGLGNREIEQAYSAYLQRTVSTPPNWNWVRSGNVECGAGHDDRQNTLAGGNQGPTQAMNWQPNQADLQEARDTLARPKDAPTPVPPAATNTQAAPAADQAATTPATTTPATPTTGGQATRKLLNRLLDKIPG